MASQRRPLLYCFGLHWACPGACPSGATTASLATPGASRCSRSTKPPLPQTRPAEIARAHRSPRSRIRWSSPHVSRYPSTPANGDGLHLPRQQFDHAHAAGGVGGDEAFCNRVLRQSRQRHRVGSRARRALEDAREQMAAILHSHADEVIFTSGATEANNLALFGLAGDPPGAILTSPIEHPSVAEPIERLAQLGFRVDRLPVARDGVVQTETIAEHLSSDTRLVSMMLANHETGALQPVADAARQLDDKPISFHCDATQAVGKMPVDFHELGVTTLALSATSFMGPRAPAPFWCAGAPSCGRNSGAATSSAAGARAPSPSHSPSAWQPRSPCGTRSPGAHPPRLPASPAAPPEPAGKRGTGRRKRAGKRPLGPLLAAHPEPVLPRLPVRLALDEPGSCRHRLFDRLRLLQRLPAPLARPASDGRAPRTPPLGHALQPQPAQYRTGNDRSRPPHRRGSRSTPPTGVSCIPGHVGDARPSAKAVNWPPAFSTILRHSPGQNRRSRLPCLMPAFTQHLLRNSFASPP